MPSRSPSAASLSAFDIAARALAETSGARLEAGFQASTADIERLWGLAKTISDDVGRWGRACRELDVAAAGAFPPEDWRPRLLESHFDDALTPQAARLLAAALDTVPEAVNPRPWRDAPAAGS